MIIRVLDRFVFSKFKIFLFYVVFMDKNNKVEKKISIKLSSEDNFYSRNLDVMKKFQEQI